MCTVYVVTNAGVNNKGNCYYTLNFGAGYYYANYNGSTYYRDPDGSSYYEASNGFSRYIDPKGYITYNQPNPKSICSCTEEEEQAMLGEYHDVSHSHGCSCYRSQGSFILGMGGVTLVEGV